MSDLPIFNRNRRYDPDHDEPDHDGLDDESDGLSGEIIVLADHVGGGSDVTIDPETGDISIATEDGGVLVQLDPPDEDDELDDGKWFRNLASRITDEERNRIVDEVLRGIEADDESRRGWLDTRAEGIRMLGIELEKSAGAIGSSTGPFEGLSAVRHPLLMEAIVRFQANAAAELYPPSGPVKVRDDQPVEPTGVVSVSDFPQPPPPGDDPIEAANQMAVDQATRDELGEALEKGFNHNLTVVDRGYRPDSVRMLFWVGFGGCGFKKIYDCPIKQRPVSRYVDAADIIVNNSVSDHRDAGRITHRHVMRPALVRRMQVAGVYRDIELHEPQFQPNAVEEAKARAQGLAATPARQEDQPRTLYESYVELDICGYEDKEGSKPTRIPLPWKVTIDKDSRELLELRRNWDEADETRTARAVFVKFGFIPAMGFYDLGMLHLLGNGDRALTAAWRIALDAGMFNNFPGFMYNEGVIRNWTNQNLVPPGGGLGIKVPPNVPINQVLQPLPYKDVSAGIIGLIQHVEQRMDRVGGTAELPVGEGKADAPVGTTLALIDQATKILAAAHINLHDAQAEEFQILKERYSENPEAFWRWSKLKRQPKWETEMFLRALAEHELVPAADPNTPSHMNRLIKCQAVKTVAMLRPEMYDMKKVDQYIFKMIGVQDPDQFFAPPMPQEAPPDPTIVATKMMMDAKMAQIQAQAETKMAEIAMKAEADKVEHQMRLIEMATKSEEAMRAGQQEAQQTALESTDRAADRQSEERRQLIKLQSEIVKQVQQNIHNTNKQNRQQAYEAQRQGRDQTHEFVQTGLDQRHQMASKGLDVLHQTEQQRRDLAVQLAQAREEARAKAAEKPKRQF